MLVLLYHCARHPLSTVALPVELGFAQFDPPPQGLAKNGLLKKTGFQNPKVTDLKPKVYWLFKVVRRLLDLDSPVIGFSFHSRSESLKQFGLRSIVGSGCLFQVSRVSRVITCHRLSVRPTFLQTHLLRLRFITGVTFVRRDPLLLRQ